MMRILCLDIEGGHGGSSRSLYHLLKNIDQQVCTVEVVARRSGRIENMYDAIGMPCRIAEEIPQASSLQNWRANLRQYVGVAYAMWKARHTLKNLAQEIEDRFDLVHFNHEGFWLIARWLRRRTSKPFVMHIRTMTYPTSMANLESSSIVRNVDHLVFISENEQNRFAKIAKQSQGSVIYNVAESDIASQFHPSVPVDRRFKIACLSNYAWERGIDRLIDIAVELRRLEQQNILFVVAGDMTIPAYLTGKLGEIGKRGGSLADYAADLGVAEYFQFLGHVSNPEAVLAACDILIKPTREANPWGRDVLEALGSARAVVSVGTYNVFVEDGVTGILQSKFDPTELAVRLLELADDRTICERMGITGQKRISTLCNGPDRAHDLIETWRKTIKERRQETTSSTGF